MSSWSSSSRSSQRRWSSPESSVAARSARATNQSRWRAWIGLRLAARLEPLGGELADRVEQREARLAVGGLVDRTQALVGERHQAVDDVGRRARRPARRRPRRPRGRRLPAKTDSRSSSRRLPVVEQVVAPGDRAAQRLLAGGQVARPPAARTSSWCSSRARIASGDSSLIRAAASSIASGMPWSRALIAATAGAFSLVTVNAGPDGDGAVDEQADGRVLAERGGVEAARSPPGSCIRSSPVRLARVRRRRQPRDRVLLLARDVERGPAGRR